MWPSPVTVRPPGPWLHSATWDGVVILGSGLLVAVPLVTYYAVATLTGTPPQAFQESQALGIAMLINLAVAFLIGGPHVYATLTTTLAERRFRERHPLLLRAALLVPVGVIALTSLRIELLLAVFFAWASVHVVHQLTYLVWQYQARGSDPLPRWSRAIDYVLVVSCLYPIALWRMLAPDGAVLPLPFGLEIAPGFFIGRVDIGRELPAAFAGQVWIAWTAGTVFALAAAAFAARTVWEWRTGGLLWPRTLLLAASAPVAFAVPMVANADVALQGLNLWHSAQYLGLVYLMNGQRKARGEISSWWVRRLSGAGNGRWYYAFVVGVAVAAGGLIGVLHYGAGFPMLQAYYCVHFSALLVHYLWDHAVFTQMGALTPVAAAVAR